MSDAARNLGKMHRTLECGVCLEIYRLPTKVPKNLTCGHTFCSQCLESLVEASKIKCSKCRKETSLPEKSVDDLPTSYVVVEMLDSTCEGCRAHQWVHRCEHCSLNLCESCRISHTEKEWQELKEGLIHTKQSVAGMRSAFNEETSLQELAEQEKATRKEVTKFWDDMEKKMTQTKDSDLKKLDDHFQKSHKDHKGWTREIESAADKAMIAVSKSLSQLDQSYPNQVMDRDKLESIKQEHKQTQQDFNLCLSRRPMSDDLQLNNTGLPQRMIESIFDVGVVDLSPRKLGSNARKNVPYWSLAQQPDHADGCGRLIPDYKSATFSQSYGKQGSGPGEFNVPMDVTTCSVTGNVVISDESNHRVHYLTSNLQPLSVYGSKGSGDQQFNNPWGVAITGKDQVFIADRSNHRILVTNDKGQYLSDIKSTPNNMNFPRGIASDNNGLLYVCDSQNYQILVIAENGKCVRKFGRKGTGDGKFFDYPSHIAVSHEDRVAVCDDKRPSSGDNDGNLHLFTKQGVHIQTVRANQPGYFTKARGVVFDPYGNIIVADESGCIVILKEDRQLLCRIGSAGTEPGQLTDPCGITLTAEGDILVCDTGNNRIQKFKVPKVSI